MGYPSGGRIITMPTEGFNVILKDNTGTDAQFRPEAGDLITISFSVSVTRNNTDLVTSARPIEIGQKQSIDDGVIFSIIPPDIIQNVSRVGGTDNVDFLFTAGDASLIANDTYLVTTISSGTDASSEGYIKIIIKNSHGDTVLVKDSLYSQGSFTFTGVNGKVTFDSRKPPKAGNIFSLETIKPVLPNIQDKYKFTIKGSKINTAKQTSDMNKIRVVPNPYVVSSLFEPELGELRLEPLRQIQFINLPAKCTIYIFTVAADIVKTLYHDSQGGTETWDLRTESGREVAAGCLYLCCQNGSDTIHGKICHY